MFERRLSTNDPDELMPQPDSEDRPTRDGERETIRYVLVGPKGATQFVYWRYTGASAERQKGYEAKFGPDEGDGPDDDGGWLYAVDLGFHSRAPLMYQSEDRGQECEYVGRCWYDGSGLNAKPVLSLLRSQGPEAVWHRLEDYYERVFDTPDDEKTVADVGFGQLLNALAGPSNAQSVPVKDGEQHG